MTTFEIIILTIIYFICYGYVFAMFIEEEKTWVRVFFAFASLVLVIYAPLIFGGMLYEKLKTDLEKSKNNGKSSI